MPDLDVLKAEIKKLSAAAVKAKLDLHDLSEELPVNWKTIPDVARAAHDAYRLLEERKIELEALR